MAMTNRATADMMQHYAPQHLVLESNGLFGHPSNWEVMNKYLKMKLDPRHYLVYASEVNQRKQTIDGIDTCGDRLVSEIEAVVHAHPSLKYISMLGHSMGGLMVRYAAGRLYNPDTHLLAGRLEPIHFITLATPHLGCDVEGESQVPMFGLLTSMMSKSMADAIALKLGKAMLKRTGPQLLMEDRTVNTQSPLDSQCHACRNSRNPVKSGLWGNSDVPAHQFNSKGPLLARLAFDVPGEGAYYSALHAFWSRTCYGNISNDHLVGWANSTLRYADQLPNLNLKDKSGLPQVKGVIREEPVHCAHAGALAHSPTTGNLPANRSVSTQQSVLRRALEPALLASQISSSSAQNAVNEGTGSPTAAAAHQATKQPGNGDIHSQDATKAEAAMTLHMEHISGMARQSLAAVVLARLRSLPWSRVDCAWRDAQMSMFAHNHIQATRGWLNWDGESVCGHLTDRFLVMEQELAAKRPGYAAPTKEFDFM